MAGARDGAGLAGWVCRGADCTTASRMCVMRHRLDQARELTRLASTLPPALTWTLSLQNLVLSGHIPFAASLALTGGNLLQQVRSGQAEVSAEVR